MRIPENRFESTRLRQPAPQLFDDLVKSQPDLRTEAAFIDGVQQITYQDVQDLSDCITKSLHQWLGVSQGSSQETQDSACRAVGLLVPDTYMRALAILGIWKAAGANVPLAIKLPEHRINTIVTKTTIKVILYQTKDCRQLISSVSSSMTKINLDILPVHTDISIRAVDVLPPETLQSLLSYNLIMCVLRHLGVQVNQSMFQFGKVMF